MLFADRAETRPDDSRITSAILKTGMAHISGLERDQLLLLPEAVDDYVALTIPFVLLTPR
jgi:hypothetical protein